MKAAILYKANTPLEVVDVQQQGPYLDGRLKIDQLVSRTYKLSEINEGFAALRSGQVARGVVVF
jgi:Zn-dependent alcohol dehydrogenase